MKTPQLVAVLVGGALACVVALGVSAGSVVGVAAFLASGQRIEDTPVAGPATREPSPEVSPSTEETSADPLWQGASYSRPLFYDNRDGVLIEQQSQQPADAELAAVWDLFSAIAGPDAASVVDVAVSDDRAEATDASVARDQDDPSLWHAEINMSSAGDRDYLLRTLVHEYGHIASLSQRDVAVLEGSCPAFEFSEGCVSDGSVLGGFLAEFWSDDEAGAEDEGASENAALARFENAGGNETFVSEYAATNGAEDFAETFTAFILGPEAELGSSAQAKVDFLAGDSSMVALRERITAAVSSR